MKTTKKLTLNKETIAHLSRTEGRTVVGGIIAKTAELGCNNGGTVGVIATCIATCPAKTCATCTKCTYNTYCQQATCICATGGC